MPYKYLTASPEYGRTQKEKYIDLFQETLNGEFENASDIWQIQEETAFSSGLYQDVNVRMNTHLISSVTGNFLGDDYKKILFKDIDHAVGLGWMYYFNNSYWVTINSEKTKNLAASTIIRRCNNTLRWIDLAGGAHTIPCSVSYIITRNADDRSPSSLVVMPSGTIEVVAQFNDETNLIIPNQRFLFGNADNWTAYRVEGGGIANFMNVETNNNTSVGYIRFTMRVDYINTDTDDLVNGVAYEKKLIYALTLDKTTIAGIPTTTVQLYPTVTMNGITVTRNVLYSSSAITKATVNSSGLVTLVANGTATITCSLEGDATINDTVGVTVSSSPSDIYEVIISPNKNYILETQTQTYTVYLYKNGSIQANTFTYSVNTRTVPTHQYTLTSNANSFTIRNNERFLEDYITVTCTADTTFQTGLQDIYLKGSW
jgi:hypothetical protein